jgi:predicted 3-demethylubiquinone-9 3-methyltransferase (glyoxalase superfamily)
VRFQIIPMLMFEGRAEEAMRLYAEVFADAQIEQLERYRADEAGPEGTVKHATLRLGEQRLRFIDSYVEHPFGFTPALSLFVDCESEAEIDGLFARLSEGGAVLMALDAYPFSRRFGWLNDRFGVSWQLSLA